MSATIKAVIFDLDGTLLDTEPLSTQAIQDVLTPFNREFTWEIKAQTLGKRGDVWPQIVIDQLNLHDELTAHELHSRWEVNMIRACSTVDKLPGVSRLVEDLHGRGVKMAIATSSGSTEVATKRLLHEDIFSKMQLVVCGNDPEVKHGKPHPDIYLLTGAFVFLFPCTSLIFSPATRLEVEPCHCLVFEDALSGVTAGKRAGMHVCAIPDPKLDIADFEQLGAVIVRDSNLENFEWSHWTFESL